MPFAILFWYRTERFIFLSSFGFERNPISTIVTGTLLQLMPDMVSVYITPLFFAPVTSQNSDRTALERPRHFFEIFLQYLFYAVGEIVRAPFTPLSVDELA